MTLPRRQFLTRSAAGLAALSALPRAIAPAAESPAAESPAAETSASALKLGLVTYNWGKDWDLETVIANCEATGFRGVELRSTHKHGVEIDIDSATRASVRKRFADSDVELVGLGSACEYHAVDPAVLQKNIDETKQFVKLCQDVGGSGVKVRPNGLPAERPVEATIEQIGRALNQVGRFGAEHGVQIRVEVHGRGTSEIHHMKSIMDVADHPNVVVCWNCNPNDLRGEGLEANYRSLQDRMGTVHIHDLRGDQYPWEKLFELLKQTDAPGFTGWTLLEDGRVPDDIVAAMKANTQAWKALVAS